MTPLALFFFDQLARVRASLHQPVQRCTAVRVVRGHEPVPAVHHRVCLKRGGNSVALHGSLSRYTAGCRCVPCREKNASYQRHWRAAKQQREVA